MNKDEVIERVCGVRRGSPVFAPGRSGVWHATCAAGPLAGADCVLKELRGDAPGLQAQARLLEAVERAQASAAGESSAVVGGLPRVLRHEFVSFPDGERVLAYVMPRLWGPTLAELVSGVRTGRAWAPRPPHTIGEALALASAVGEAVAAASSAVPCRTLVHGDVKPANVMVLAGGPAAARRARQHPVSAPPARRTHVTCALVDLDGASLLDERGGSADEGSGPARPLHTPGYAAPELLVPGDAPLARADVFSLGVVAHELLCGAWPYVGAPPAGAAAASWGEFFAACARGEPGGPAVAPAPILPADVRSVLAGLLACDPAERPGPDEAARELARLACAHEGDPSRLAHPAPEPEAPPTPA